MTEPAPPPPYRLTKAAARSASNRIAKRFIRRNGRVTSLFGPRCARRGERRFACRATAKGSTATSRTTCRLRIAVTARNRHPRARLRSARCRTRTTARLSASRAQAAIRARGAELAGKPVRMTQLERLSQASFMALVEWTRPAPSDAAAREECFALLEASLGAAGVGVSLVERGCEPVPAA